MDYTATATLIGPISPDEAEQIAHRLRDYAAAVAPHEQGSRFAVTFTLRAGSSREAVIRALSLSDDLGHRLVGLKIFP